MTDPLDYDETTLSPEDGEGFSLTRKEEPQANQAGISPPGMLDALTDFINYGVSNGNFRKGPPDPSQNITPAGSVSSASNFLPDWRFVQSSNTNITASQVRDASSPSGSNLRFTFASGSANDEAYIEQIIDMGGSRWRNTGDFLRAVALMPTGSGLRIEVRGQYLNTDGSLVGMPAEVSTGVNLTSSPLYATSFAAFAGAPPGQSRYVRFRVIAKRNSGTGAATLDLTDVRRDKAVAQLLVGDESLSGTYKPVAIAHRSGIGYVSNPAVNSGSLMPLGVQLVPLTFVQLNLAATTSNELQPSDNALGLAFPRVTIPWAGSFVGMSYRISTALTAGTLSLRVFHSGSEVWTAHSLTSASAQTGEATQAIGTDTFAAGETVGVNAVTNGAFLPTTMDIHVTLWLAVTYTGA